MARLSGAERRRQIVKAAYEVIVEKGLGYAATRDVTRKLNVGSGLLHHYFPGWRELRAEAVRTFVLAEIEDVDRMLAGAKDDDLVHSLTAWLADDPGGQHWGLWLNAIEEARRDPQMASAVKEAYRTWHAVLVRVINRLVEAGHGECPDPAASAWRLSVLMDGLAGILILGEPSSEPDYAKRLLKEQFAMELNT